MRQLAHSQLVDFDAFHTQLARHGVANSALGVVVLNGDDHAAGLLGSGADDIGA